MDWDMKYGLLFTIDRGIHSFNLGPFVSRNWEGWTYPKIKFMPNGLHLNYQIRPSIESRRFDLYFEASTNCVYDYAKGIGTIVQYGPPYNINSENFTGYRFAIEGYAGYGFKFNLTKSIYLYQGFGFGGHWGMSKINYETHKDLYSSGGDWSGLLKFGIGYRF
jgi:hypothetical protein